MSYGFSLALPFGLVFIFCSFDGTLMYRDGIAFAFVTGVWIEYKAWNLWSWSLWSLISGLWSPVSGL